MFDTKDDERYCDNYGYKNYCIKSDFYKGKKSFH